jgi:hypothetical protein
MKTKYLIVGPPKTIARAGWMEEQKNLPYCLPLMSLRRNKLVVSPL